MWGMINIVYKIYAQKRKKFMKKLKQISVIVLLALVLTIPMVFFVACPNPVPTTHLITFTAGTGGTISASIGQTNVVSGTDVEEGVNIVFTAVPNDGQRVASWTNNGTIVTGQTGNTFSINNVTSAHTIVVAFEVIPLEKHTVTFSAVGTNGTITATVGASAITSPTEVEEGAAIIFTASPNAGYRVYRWTLGGTTVANNTTNTFTHVNLTGDIVVTVEFEAAPKYEITIYVDQRSDWQYEDFYIYAGEARIEHEDEIFYGTALEISVYLLEDRKGVLRINDVPFALVEGLNTFSHIIDGATHFDLIVYSNLLQKLGHEFADRNYSDRNPWENQVDIGGWGNWYELMRLYYEDMSVSIWNFRNETRAAELFPVFLGDRGVTHYNGYYIGYFDGFIIYGHYLMINRVLEVLQIEIDINPIQQIVPTFNYLNDYVDAFMDYENDPDLYENQKVDFVIFYLWAEHEFFLRLFYEDILEGFVLTSTTGDGYTDRTLLRAMRMETAEQAQDFAEWIFLTDYLINAYHSLAVSEDGLTVFYGFHRFIDILVDEGLAHRFDYGLRERIYYLQELYDFFSAIEGTTITPVSPRLDEDDLAGFGDDRLETIDITVLGQRLVVVKLDCSDRAQDLIDIRIRMVRVALSDCGYIVVWGGGDIFDALIARADFNEVRRAYLEGNWEYRYFEWSQDFFRYGKFTFSIANGIIEMRQDGVLVAYGYIDMYDWMGHPADQRIVWTWSADDFDFTIGVRISFAPVFMMNVTFFDGDGNWYRSGQFIPVV